MAPYNFVILTVSDTCYAKINIDLSGPKLEERVKEAFPDSDIIKRAIVPDDKQIIAQFLFEWSLKGNVDVILTTGGTGFSSRDVTPEATKLVIDKEAPGLSYAMISKSLAITEMAVLSRPVCGIKYKTLIINLPGSVKGATECFGFIKSALPHAIVHLRENRDVIKSEHARLQSISSSKVKINQAAFRNRSSPYPLIEMEKGLEIIFSACPRDECTETIDIAHSLNRILAENVYANEPMPPFNASIKDGYAVKTSDGAGIRIVRDVVAAGDLPSNRPLDSGEIISISTGAPIPKGADAVVQIEDTALVNASADGSKELEVEIKVAPKLNQDIRPIGSEIAVGELVINKGDLITAGHIGVLASLGKTRIQAYKRARIGLISTGNELQAPHEELKQAHIRDCNKLALLNLLKQYGFGANDCGIAKDNPDSVKQAFTGAFLQHDVVVTTGGVSMGEFDVIKNVLIEDFDATIHFGRINMRPGQPTTFATCNFQGKEKIIFGLPGNPVSAMVTTIVFLIPTLRHLENSNQTSFPHFSVVLGEEFTVARRPEYARVKITHVAGENLPVAHSVGNQISSKINSFIAANALMFIPSNEVHQSNFKKGDILKVILLNTFNME